MKMVGYLVKHPDGLYGERGLGYDYILASNGVFVEAEGPLLAARVRVAEAEIRGLAPVEPRVVLRHGLIPGRLWELALSVMLADVAQERYVGVSWVRPSSDWSGHYQLYVPDDQERSPGGVQYDRGDKVVLDLHSHGKMRAFFSAIDDGDEQALKLYAVVGKLNGRPQVRLRVGVYGYFHEIPWNQVFSGSLIGVDDRLDDEVELADLAELAAAKGLELGFYQRRPYGLPDIE